MGVTGVSGARAAPAPPPDAVITVGSFDFAESRLLAEIYSQTLEGADIRVRRAFGLGPREFVAPALARRARRVRPRVRGHRGPVPEPRHAPRPGADVTDTHAALLRALNGTERHVPSIPPRRRTPTPSSSRARRADAIRPEHGERPGRASRRSSPSAVHPSVRPVRSASSGCARSTDCEFEEIVELDAGGPADATRRSGTARSTSRCSSRTDPAIWRRRPVELQRRPRLAAGGERHSDRAHRGGRSSSGRRLVDPVNEVSARLTTDVLRELNEQMADGRVGPGGRVAGWLDARGVCDDHRRRRSPHRASRHRRITSRSPGRPRPAPPPPPAAVRRGPAAPAEASASPARAGCRVGGPARLDGHRDATPRPWRARHRPGRLGDPAADRAPAHRLAHRRRWTPIDRVGSGWTVTVVGVALAARARGVPAVAPPVHVPRRHRS